MKHLLVGIMILGSTFSYSGVELESIDEVTDISYDCAVEAELKYIGREARLDNYYTRSVDDLKTLVTSHVFLFSAETTASSKLIAKRNLIKKCEDLTVNHSDEFLTTDDKKVRLVKSSKSKLGYLTKDKIIDGSDVLPGELAGSVEERVLENQKFCRTLVSINNRCELVERNREN